MKDEITAAYSAWLLDQERSAATMEKYLRSVSAFFDWLGEERLGKEAVIRYKASLSGAPSTVNGVISAINSLVCFLGHPEWKVRQVKYQKKIFRPKGLEMTKAEYERLILTAERLGDERLARIVETIGTTGMRVSELRFLTCEVVECKEFNVQNKGKVREVILTAELVKKLKKYCKSRGIKSGPIFISRSGKPLARTQIWAELKRLCEKAGVDPKKGFPHNLRHLFAVIHYRLHRDIAKLADLLGHSSVNTTRIYLMETGEEHERQLEAMGMVIKEEPPAEKPEAA